MVVVEELGLITCERGVGWPEGQTHSRKRTGNFSPNRPHIEDEVKDQEDELERWERQMKSAKWRVEERSNTQAHDTWMV